MRIRTIKPEFWTDSKLVRLPIHIRLFFVGLWQMADDWGALEDEPERIGMTLFPGDDVDPYSCLDALESLGFVVRYLAADGRRLLHIPHFYRHQKIDKRAARRFSGGKWRKAAIPAEVRRHIAEVFGCSPGGQAQADCYYCGQPGTITWNAPKTPKAVGWITFGCLELDHFEAEIDGGCNDKRNIVLACRSCNRKKGCYESGYSFIAKKLHEAGPILVNEYPDLDCAGADPFFGSGKTITRRVEDLNNPANSRQLPPIPADSRPIMGMDQGSGIRDQGSGSEGEVVALAGDQKEPESVEAAIPTPEEVITAGDMVGIPPDYCRHYHEQQEIRNRWLTGPAGRERVRGWRIELKSWWERDKATWGKNGTNGSARPTSAAGLVMTLKAKAAAATEERKQLLDRHTYPQPDGGKGWGSTATDEIKERIKELSAMIKDCNRRVTEVEA